MKRQLITIDSTLCNGCGNCITGCPEGALQLIDGRARLVSDLFCDGLGACIGTCPNSAISITEREAEPYDEYRVMANIMPQGENTLIAHLKHLHQHGEKIYLDQALSYLRENNLEIPTFTPPVEAVGPVLSGCPGSRAIDLRTTKPKDSTPVNGSRQISELRTWPVQL
jgi:ferredoxin